MLTKPYFQTVGQQEETDFPLSPRLFVFVLLENFSLIAFTSAIEPLRIANRISRKELYAWRLLSESGESVICSNGVSVKVDSNLQDIKRTESLIVCSGEDVRRYTSKNLLTWIRKESRKGMPVGALCTGTYVLARAGILDGYTVTVHWENREALVEEFPDLELSTAIYVVDRKRLTAAGGSAALDLILRLISIDHGVDLSNSIADQMIYASIRTEYDEQRPIIPTRVGVRHPKLTNVLQLMNENLEEPISPGILATRVGVSTRQLERLFRRYLKKSPKKYYMTLRLQKARNLLLQTNMSVINVALACGFTSPSHFSKCYRLNYDTTPYRERGLSSPQK